MDVSAVRLNADRTRAVFIAQTWQGSWSGSAPAHPGYQAKSYRQLTPLEEFSWRDAHFIGDRILALGSDMKSYGLNQNPVFTWSMPERANARY